MDYDKWVSLGERLGLKDGDLRDYVQKKESEYIDREEKNIRREEDKRRFEAKRKAKEAEREVERLEKEAGREEERRRFEAERLEKEAEREGKKRLFQAERIAVDLIGPITPVSEKGNRYILTVVDYATRYPEAVALPRSETENIAEALLDIFARVGFPSEILSDRGSQFTSQLMEELFTTPYNPKCNGLCERMNGILKSMLKKMCQERHKDWDRYLFAVLFAYREVPQSSTGFSPFELLYGRTVRGPMQALKELWTETEVPETRNTYEYVLDLRSRLEQTCKIARENLSNSQEEYKHHYDKKTRPISLKKGDKKYEEREDRICASVAVIEAENNDDTGAVDDEHLLELVDTQGEETYRDVNINDQLTLEQKSEVNALLQEFEDIFTDVPGTTDLESHNIELTDKTPIRVRQYTIPYAKRTAEEDEIKNVVSSNQQILIIILQLFW
ncbi:uncharacterized protein LOC132754618 [Ruditapes philippinarum]|uniref:uncharacterized protein LOC132754618 n=1 Tax=Ruditapes philippinarum TaxID=129788 RepID=UPI00295A6DE0|nr:uncharacterized protein LOC132754618 [Ruditapes philippinarum]